MCDDEERIITVGKKPDADCGRAVYGESTRVASAKRMFCDTFEVSVYMAGDMEHAKQVIRRYCRSNPCCVTVTPTAYIYRGGAEDGFVVTFRNYPKHPTDGRSLEEQGRRLGAVLRDELGQDSFMVVSPNTTALDTERGAG